MATEPADQDAIQPGTLEAGQVVDGFRLDERAHQGGMANLWFVTRVDPPPAGEPDLPLIMKVPRIKGGDDPTTIVGSVVAIE